mmetsp:Transcript_53323/g.164038  ORF Transcript_53323/g.164038 Transcript_53323/m.164038 type:complete len:320 (+) Transcript_53323:650-1609(+)
MRLVEVRARRQAEALDVPLQLPSRQAAQVVEALQDRLDVLRSQRLVDEASHGGQLRDRGRERTLALVVSDGEGRREVVPQDHPIGGRHVHVVAVRVVARSDELDVLHDAAAEGHFLLVHELPRGVKDVDAAVRQRRGEQRTAVVSRRDGRGSDLGSDPAQGVALTKHAPLVAEPEGGSADDAARRPHDRVPFCGLLGVVGRRLDHDGDGRPGVRAEHQGVHEAVAAEPPDQRRAQPLRQNELVRLQIGSGRLRIRPPVARQPPERDAVRVRVERDGDVAVRVGARGRGRAVHGRRGNDGAFRHRPSGEAQHVIPMQFRR